MNEKIATSPPEDEQAHAAPRDKLVRWTVIAFVVVVVILLLYMLYRGGLTRMVSQRQAELRDEGVLLTVREIVDAYPDMPPGENASVAYMDAGGRLVALSREEQDLVPNLSNAEYLPPGEPYPPDMLAAMRNYLALNETVLRDLRRADALDRSRLPVDLEQFHFDVSLPPIGAIRRAAFLRDIAARVDAEDGNVGAAVDEIIGILRMGRSLRAAPELITQLARVSINSIACESLADLLSRRTLDEASLARLAKVLAEVELGLEPFRLAMQFEMAGFDSAFESEYLRLMQYSVTARSKPIIVAYRLAGMADIDHDMYLTLQAELVRVFDLPEHDIMGAAERHEVKIKGISSWRLGTHAITPVYTSVFKRVLSDTTRIRALQAAVAIERYRLATGDLPETLDDLVPNWLESVPRDTFRDAPLNYVKTSAGYRVYGVGLNGLDDGGEVGTDPSEPLDIVVIVEQKTLSESPE